MHVRFLIQFLLSPYLIASCGQATLNAQPASEPFRPNILWITSEDNGQHLGCYGDRIATTPHLDSLAAKGMKYVHAWSNAPVCAPARTTIVTGMYPTSLGAQHMRSAVKLPGTIKLLPRLLREQGYYCTNNSKTDYNLLVDEKLHWNASSNRAHWRNREAGQPFFAVFNINTTHESQLRTRPHQAVHDPSKVSVPPYHPDTPEVRKDWAQYYDKITEMDQEVGEILQQLESDGLAETTIVFYFGDHGCGMPRGKRWLYESGLRVPMIVQLPEKTKAFAGGEYVPGTTNQRLVGFVDLVPTMLSLIGVCPPNYLQGRAFLGQFASEAPQYLYAFRDRMDERVDMSRAVRNRRYSYIRNFMPQRPQGAYLEYMFQTPTTVVWKELFDEGKLNEVQSVFWKTKSSEELYDLDSDPNQILNLANDTEHAETLYGLREELHDWMIRTADLGLLPEGEMWARAGEAAPYEIHRNTLAFPINDIAKVAELASKAQTENWEELRKYSNSSDSAVRYWLTSGLLLRTELNMNREACIDVARELAQDTSPYVRCLANEVLARFGNDKDRNAAIKELIRASDVRTEGFFVSLAALNSLDWCVFDRQGIGTTLDFATELPNGLSQRYESYLPRMKSRINQIVTQ